MLVDSDLLDDWGLGAPSLFAGFLGAIHMETLFCVNARFASFWLIVHMDPVNAVRVNALF